MRTIKYLLLFVAGMMMLTSCFDEYADFEVNDDGKNIVTFERIAANLTGEANGTEYEFLVRVRLVGPTVMDMTEDVVVNFVPRDSSTAEAGKHFEINTNPLTLTASNNYLGILSITLVTEGNTPPLEGTPAWDEYVAPMLYLDLEVSGTDKAVGSGKGGIFTLNYIAPNPYKGDYNAYIIYRHPSLGDYPNNIYVEEYQSKTLEAVTGSKCETWFGVWDTYLCWITVDPNTQEITFEVDDLWPYDVKIGDPFDASKVSQYHPDTKELELYYHYAGSGGFRVFWENFEPV